MHDLLVFYMFTFSRLLFADQLYCPASSIIDTAMDGTFAYPMDIFDHMQLKNLQDAKYHDQIYNCSSSDMDRPSVIHKCSSLSQCPLTEQHITVAKSRMLSWNVSHSFCEIRKKMRNPEEYVRVVILGGSVTHGSATKGTFKVYFDF